MSSPLIEAGKSLVRDFKDTNPSELRFSGFKNFIKAMAEEETRQLKLQKSLDEIIVSICESASDTIWMNNKFTVNTTVVDYIVALEQQLGFNTEKISDDLLSGDIVKRRTK